MKPAVLFVLFAVAITIVHAQFPDEVIIPEWDRESLNDEASSSFHALCRRHHSRPRSKPARDQTRGLDDTDCPEFCLDIYDPVRDEEGHAYLNECYMKREKCESNEETVVPIVEDFNQTNDDSTSHCANACPQVDEPVCGSDGVMYGNLCELNIAACEHPELNIVEDPSGETCYGSTKNPDVE